MKSKEFWLSKNLTEGAANVLVNMGIHTCEDLVGSIIIRDWLLKKENCAEKTSEEIVNFRRKLLPTTNTSSKKVNKRAVQILKKISVNEVIWDFSTIQLIRESNARTIYDLAMINLPMYMHLDNYDLQSYLKIKSKVFEILTEINYSFSDAHMDETISLNIFIEKPARE